MFKTIRLKWRLTMLVLAALAGLILLGTLQIAHLRTQLLDDRKASLAMLIDVAGSTASEFQAAEVMEAALPEAERGGGLLRQIADGSRAARELVRELAASTREQSQASTALAVQVERIAHQVEQTCTSMNATAPAARSLLQTAGELDGAVSRFKI